MGSKKAPGILPGYSGKTLDGRVRVARRLKGASRINPRLRWPVSRNVSFHFISFHSIHALTDAFPGQISEHNLHSERKPNAMLEIPNASERFQVLKVWK